MPESAEALTRKALAGLARFVILLGILLFLPAWSLNFWQAWLFWLIFSVSSLLITVYFLKRDPGLIERRLRGGPSAETEQSQKIIQALVSLLFIGEIVVSVLDHRFHWSDVPPALVILGNVFVAMGFVIVFPVFKENSFASATIEVNRSQRVVSTGPTGLFAIRCTLERY